MAKTLYPPRMFDEGVRVIQAPLSDIISSLYHSSEIWLPHLTLNNYNSFSFPLRPAKKYSQKKY